MNILVLHNKYKLRGGEDAVVELECSLLRRAGHQVYTVILNNSTVDDSTLFSRMGLFLNSIWSFDSYVKISSLVREKAIDIVHVHNTVPLLSPAVFHASLHAGAATVFTVHNYRLICPGATLYRSGAVCSDCVRLSSALAVWHKCYRDSYAASAAVVAGNMFHYLIRTYQSCVHRYISLTHFARGVVGVGLDVKMKMMIKPNFVQRPEFNPNPNPEPYSYMLYVGRLSEEKGIRVLLAAWERISSSIQLYIVGAGPLADLVAQHATRQPNIHFCGQMDMSSLEVLYKGAEALVVPSIWFEGLPMVIVEAYSYGVPVIASDHGGLAEIVPRNLGWRFSPDDSQNLVKIIEEVHYNVDERRHKGLAVRKEYEARYSPESSLKTLISIYQAAQIDRRGGGCI